MTRKEFIRLTTGLASGLGLHAAGEHPLGAAVASRSRSGLDESYLELGLLGMAGAGSWFPAHLGAAVLAGYYLCRENHFDAETQGAIKAQIDALIKTQPGQFQGPAKEKPDRELIERIPAALAPAVAGGLRAHGHAVIFATLALKALRDAPHMAQPRLVNQLCGLSREIARKAPRAPQDETPYASPQAMVEANFDSLARFKDLLGRPGIRRPNFTHMTTHTEALLTLGSMGYRDLAKQGHAGHRAHIGEPVPSFDPARHPVTGPSASLEEVGSREYWQDPEHLRQWNQAWNEKNNPNGYWIAFGHLFKLLYSYHRLVGLIDDPEKVRLCSRILLERYFNPAVQGG